MYTYTKLNPKSTSYEFMGPPGAILVITLCNVLVYFLYLVCNEDGCPPKWFWNFSPETFLAYTSKLTFFECSTLCVYVGWIAYLALLYFIIPCEEREGTQLRNGQTLKYKINAFKSLLVTLSLVILTLFVYGPAPFVFISDHFLSLTTAGVIISTTQAFYLYLSSFVGDKLLALGGNSGNVVYDFFIGRELNPRIGSLDLKYFCELRPGLIGWIMLNFSMAVKQYVTYGKVTDSMLLVLLLEGYYVTESLYNEAKVLTTMDITTDGFGWMLSFGDLALVPFTYSLQARYLASHPIEIGAFWSSLIVCTKLLGYYIFRSANNEKNEFRKNPDSPGVKHLKYMKTEAGSKLIISGWWGMSRHINYFGDWLMSLAWCLPTGFNTVFTYYYAIFFAVLLIHRSLRDDHKCKQKYKKDWDRYCEIVPYKIIPYVY
ncbi:ERG4/ERG24 ergosterol biosynthesis protein [Basidiobolus meristosporus CBS 931.73]|uniref:Delta(14)-sterol reductase ERG24 n=1 Tax=Basidiobolus meristosporus CBS 931.73 TaxID=1314790 RepID=A0A1Y1XLL7_9FUNG|nr:ERG4/ERG24 ergosterol biosynthesis protein [Basidiobolus meristosporus CBS 931.73]|eukprot:ORX86396.1 ERG4/ERG24 ergosterol biosynthesis protein [Basidiobolus meristosporus CBS 931.73]